MIKNIDTEGKKKENREDQVPKEVYEDSIDIQNASHTLLEIVGNILDINKIESDKMELIIQKSVELGANSIIPVNMKRCVVKLEGKDEIKKNERWQKIAESAAKQCGRGFIPEVKHLINVKEICNWINEYDVIIVAYENEKENTLKAELKKLKATDLKIGIVIGPEGGFEESDIKLLKESGAKIVTLGDRILRTETVALNVLSIIMYEFEQ